MIEHYYSYDIDQDIIEECCKRRMRLGNWEYTTLEEAIEGRKKYLGEMATRLRAKEVSLYRADGTEVTTPTTVQESGSVVACATAADVLLEAVRVIVKGTESTASIPVKAVLLAAAKAVQETR